MSEEKNTSTIDLMPQLKKVTVPTGKLILDPNNPRFLVQDDTTTAQNNFQDSGISNETRDKILYGAYKIEELKKSIITNGWLPIDQIFVRRHLDTDYYVVQEGNRRVAAINELLRQKDIPDELRQTIENLDVMEIVDDCDEETLKIKISYLLGARHHGSLKQWSAFAQAHNIYKQYIRLAEQSDGTFQWNDFPAQQVASALSIGLELVKQRLRVYRAMKHLDQVVGGIKARYYSLFEEALKNRGKSKLPEYIQQDSETMFLNSESIKKMDNLCHFSKPTRELAPMRNPAEWRKFDKILQEESEERRTELISEVEVNQRRPSDVWREREAEIYLPQWSTWLRKVSQILSRIQFGDDLKSNEAKEAGKRLGDLLNKLQAKTLKKGAVSNE